MFYNFFEKKSSGGADTRTRSDTLATWDSWSSDLADTQLITNDNKGSRFLCVIGVYSKYARVDPLKDKKDIINTKSVQKINCLTAKQNTIWADKGKEFYNQ